MITTKSMQALDAWRDDNPIRRWRVDQRISLRRFALHMRVNTSSVVAWESGTMPNEDNWQRIAAAMRMSPAELMAQWETWLAERPA